MMEIFNRKTIAILSASFLMGAAIYLLIPLLIIFFLPNLFGLILALFIMPIIGIYSVDLLATIKASREID